MKLSEKNSAHLPMFIVDVLRYDLEEIGGILELLNDDTGIGWRNFWDRDFTIDDVIPALQQLIEKSFVSVVIPVPNERAITDSDIKDIRNLGLENEKYPSYRYWFRLIDKGREAWEKWEPPKAE